MQQAWVGSVYGASASGKSAGVLTLINKALPHQVLSHSCDESSGRWSCITLQVGLHVLDLWNVYGPNVDNSLFLDTISSSLTRSSSARLTLLGGDFNAVPSYLEDRAWESRKTAPRPSSQDSHLETFLSTTALTDVWRYLHPLEREFTHFSHVHGAFSRIDLFLSSQHMLKFLDSVWICLVVPPHGDSLLFC